MHPAAIRRHENARICRDRRAAYAAIVVRTQPQDDVSKVQEETVDVEADPNPWDVEGPLNAHPQDIIDLTADYSDDYVQAFSRREGKRQRLCAIGTVRGNLLNL